MWRFKFGTGPSGKTVRIINEEDFNQGFGVSYGVDSQITELLEMIGCYELMEGVYEVTDEDEVRETLLDFGLIEI